MKPRGKRGMRHAAAGWLVRAASLLVPRKERPAWLEEWRGELWHAPEAPPLRSALGSLRDAAAVRRLARGHRALDERGRVDTSGGSPVEGVTAMGRETRIAVRGLLRAPGFTLVAVITLALGIGGSTAIYTLLDRVVLDPLPYPESDRLVRLKNQVPGVAPDEEWQLATGQYVFYNEAPRTLEKVGVWRRGMENVETPTGPQRVSTAMVSVEMMDLLGAEARLGRLIAEHDDRPGGAAVAMLSHGAWIRHWGGDPEVVGRGVPVNGEPLEIIGVLEPGVDLPGESEAPGLAPPELWTPIRIDPAGPHWPSHVYRAIARLAPGFIAEDAERELAGLMPRLPELFPQAYSQGFFDRYGFRPVVRPLEETVVGDMARNLWVLLGAVGLVLLVACANVANLFLARMEDRSRELSVRAALGAGRAAIARHLLAESLVLGLVGGAVAVLVARWGLSVLITATPDALPRLDNVRMDGSALLFATALSVGVGVALALLPLARYGRAEAGELAGGGRRSSAGRERQRVRGALVVAQVALALTLTVGAGLLVETLRRLHDVDPGFDPEGVLTANVTLTTTTYPHPEDVWRFLDQALERVRALPGVTAAGATGSLPLTGSYGCTVQGFEDRAVYQRMEDAGMTTCAGQELTAPGYFEAMGIPVLEGRGFEDADNDRPERGVAVVSRAFADRFWPGEEPIGKGIRPNGATEGPLYRVVGVVGDVQDASLEEEPAVVVHYPVRPIPSARFAWPGAQTLVVRTSLADPMSVFPALRAAVQEVDASIPLANPRPMGEVVDASLSRVAFVSLLLQVAAAVALLLAAVGLYGVVSYVVGGRTREIGTRMAMGARPGQVEREVVRRSLALAALGTLVGLALAAGTTRVLEGLLFGVEPTHPVVFATAAAVLGAVAAVAAWLPARRAARIDPAEALRAE